MAAEAEAARNRPPLVPQLRTQAERMAFIVSTVQGMEKNIQEIMENQKSFERVGETKFDNMDVKVLCWSIGMPAMSPGTGDGKRQQQQRRQ
ncbi:hypothetical protein D1007_57308 [Hordeum vulgare]|nr:hypothetical protein D1007_57308 [Hordeum vulgare]